MTNPLADWHRQMSARVPICTLAYVARDNATQPWDFVQREYYLDIPNAIVNEAIKANAGRTIGNMTLVKGSRDLRPFFAEFGV